LALSSGNLLRSDWFPVGLIRISVLTPSVLLRYLINFLFLLGDGCRESVTMNAVPSRTSPVQEQSCYAIVPIAQTLPAHRLDSCQRDRPSQRSSAYWPSLLAASNRRVHSGPSLFIQLLANNSLGFTNSGVFNVGHDRLNTPLDRI
jgi:hypothetical protein